MQDYYFMFPTSLFMVGYFVASYRCKKKDNLLVILRGALPLIGYYFVGLMMAGVSLIPTVFYILNNSRVGESSPGILFDFKVYYFALESFFVGPYNVCNELPTLFVNFEETGHISWSSFYGTSLVVLALCCGGRFWGNIKLRPFYFCYLFYLVLMFIVPLNSIMHGLSNASFRWSFLVIFLGLVLVALALDNNLFDGRCLIVYGVLFGLLILSIVLCCVFNVYDFSEYRLVFGVWVLCAVLAFGYYYLIVGGHFGVLLCVVLMELLAFNYFGCYFDSLGFDYFENTMSNWLSLIHIKLLIVPVHI